MRAYLKQIDAGEKLPLIAATPSQGLAEAFFGLGEALMSEGGLGASAVFLQYALYLEPEMPFALATLANVYEGAKRYELANAAYARIPKGSRARHLDRDPQGAQPQRHGQGRRGQGGARHAAASASRAISPSSIRSAPIMRGHKRYEEAVGYYTRAIIAIDHQARGAALELLLCPRHVLRAPEEAGRRRRADLQQALKLSPDQAQVLNYLGYSWVDMGRNLKQGLAHIEKAVRLKPDDGYITDSLGWAHFKLGNFKDAARWLEKAVELRPDDPVLNDHLGDALWRVGREREARFQWEQSLALKPEPEDRSKTENKLKGGLPVLTQAKPQPTKQVQSTQPQRRRTEARPSQNNPVQ